MIICPKCGCSDFESSDYNGCHVDVCNKCLFVQKYYTNRKEHDNFCHKIQEEKKQEKQPPTVVCPTCQSTNIRKIGAIESGASIFAFGLYSKKINKTFKCNNCGYTW